MNYKATALYNARREAMLDGFKAGDAVEAIGVTTVEAASFSKAASAVFEAYNIGGKQGHNRSMSVGDVISVETEDGTIIFLTVAGAGFGMLDEAPPVN